MIDLIEIQIVALHNSLHSILAIIFIAKYVSGFNLKHNI